MSLFPIKCLAVSSISLQCIGEEKYRRLISYFDTKKATKKKIPPALQANTRPLKHTRTHTHKHTHMHTHGSGHQFIKIHQIIHLVSGNHLLWFSKDTNERDIHSPSKIELYTRKIIWVEGLIFGNYNSWLKKRKTVKIYEIYVFPDLLFWLYVYNYSERYWEIKDHHNYDIMFHPKFTI